MTHHVFNVCFIITNIVKELEAWNLIKLLMMVNYVCEIRFLENLNDNNSSRFLKENVKKNCFAIIIF